MSLRTTDQTLPLEGMLIDLSPSNDTVGCSQQLSRAPMNGDQKEFPLPFDLVWEKTPDMTRSDGPFQIASPIPIPKPSLPPIAHAYHPKVWSYQHAQGEIEAQDSQSEVALGRPSPHHNNLPPTTQEKPQFKTYADASNYFYASKDPSILETPLATCSETPLAPVVPPSHPPEPLKYYTKPGAIKNSELQGRQNWAAVPAFDNANNAEKRSESFPPRNDSLSGQYNFEEPVSGAIKDPWSAEITPRWDIAETRGVSRDPRRDCSPDQFADATHNSQHLGYQREEPPHQRARTQLRERHFDSQNENYEYMSSARVQNDTSPYPHYERPLLPERQATFTPPTKVSAPLFDWEGSKLHLGSKFDDPGRPERRVSSTFNDSPKGDQGWGRFEPCTTSTFHDPTKEDDGWRRSGSRASSTFDDPTTGVHGWAAADRVNAVERDFVEIIARQAYAMADPPKPRHPATIFSKRTSRYPNFVLPPPDEEPPKDTSWDSPEWKSYNTKKGRPLRLPEF